MSARALLVASMLIVAVALTPMPEPVVSVADTNGSFPEALALLKGGGTLYVPSGEWLSPPLNLSSNLTLYLAANAIVKANTSAHWPLIAPLSTYGQGHDHPGPRWQPFIGGWDVHGLTIGGENGTIDGSGGYWWARSLLNETHTRPSLFECVRCTDLVLDNVTVRNSGFWTIHPVLSRRVTARRLTVLNPNIGMNTDGFDPDSTSDVLLEDSFFSTGDDAVAIKAGWDCAGYGPDGAPSTNITIRNLSVWGGGGGISIGSEMSGGVAGVLVEHVHLAHGSYGIQVKTGATRGGFVRDIMLRNITIDRVKKAAVQIDADYGFANPWCGDDPVRVPPLVSNITLSNVRASDTWKTSLHLMGQNDTPTTGVHLVDVTFDKAVFDCLGGVAGSAVRVSPQPPAECGLVG